MEGLPIMKTKKKIWAAFLCLLVLFGTVGCGRNDGNVNDATRGDGVMDDAADDVKKGADDLMDGVDDMTDDVRNGMDDAVNDGNGTGNGTGNDTENERNNGQGADGSRNDEKTDMDSRRTNEADRTDEGWSGGDDGVNQGVEDITEGRADE